MLKIIIFFVIVLNSFLVAQDECISCHKIEKFDQKNHDFSCVECHIVPQKRNTYTHEDIVLHPDSPQTINLFCTSCHQKDINNVSKSLHATLKGSLNITRTLWGIKDSNVTLATLPLPKEHITEPKDLVDDFLRRKCLKCHTGNQGSGEEGMYRGQNCMSCHIAYGQDGQYRGSDITMQGKKPYAKIHSLSQKVEMSTCLSCHNKTFIGTDYQGIFPKDHDKSYRAPLTKEGLYPQSIYGTDYHSLTEDIHFQKGLTCLDCHTKNEMMGDGKSYENESQTTTAHCATCHKTLSKNEAHETYHSKVSCSACHASWQMNNYELSVFRDDTKDYNKWKDLINQEDTYLANFLRHAIATKQKPEPMMPDWVSGEMKEGIWYSGWRFRRWEHLLLGNTKEGMIKILRPLFQYRISYRDKNGVMILDDVQSIDGKKIEAFMPYDPHTITKNAKSCESCHENPLLINPPKDTNTVLDLLTGDVKNGTPLSKEQLDKLQSQKYRNIRAKMF